MPNTTSQFEPGRPVVLRGGMVLPMTEGRAVLDRADALVTGDTITAVGPDLWAPERAAEVDATRRVALRGMIDTHRHMWQTAMRGYGADWTLTQYFVWYYLEHGKRFRPEDVHAGNVLAALEAIDAGVTTVVDWSHGLQTLDHADAAVDALRSVPGRSFFASATTQPPPAGWTGPPGFPAFAANPIDRKSPRLT